MPDGQVGERKVYKDSAVRAVDDFFSGQRMPLEAAFSYAESFLGEKETLAQLTERATARRSEGVEEGVEIDEEQARHFLQHWDEASQQEMRRGYREAVKLASQDGPVPIETYWITGPNAGFQIFARRGPRQVTVLVFIPPHVEARARDPWTREPEITPDESAS